VDEWKRLRDEEAELKARAEAEGEDLGLEVMLMPEEKPAPAVKLKDVLSTLTPEEKAAAQRQALLRQYGYVEGGPEDEANERGDAPPRGESARAAEEKKAAEERKALIEAALKLDGKKKKYKKQQEGAYHGSSGKARADRSRLASAESE